MLALSLHAVFEGLAVGLEDEKAGVWQMFAAVASHKETELKHRAVNRDSLSQPFGATLFSNEAADVPDKASRR